MQPGKERKGQDAHAEAFCERGALLERGVLVFVVQLVEGGELEGGMAMPGFFGVVVHVHGRAGLGRGRGCSGEGGMGPRCEGGQHGGEEKKERGETDKKGSDKARGRGWIGSLRYEN